VAIILGPGGAKAFAHVGVLKVFQQQRVPVDRVIGLEWGAFIGALYANKGTAHDLEWKLYKWEQQNPWADRGLFARSPLHRSIKFLDSYFQDAFQKESLERGRVSFSCPTRAIWTGTVTWQSKGLTKDVMKRCLPYPPLFKIEGSTVAGASQITEAVEQLMREGYRAIVFVNVLGSALPVPQNNLLNNEDYVVLWQEVKRALAEASRLGVDIIQVDTSTYAMSQFDAQKAITRLGEDVAVKAAAKLINKYGY